MEQIEYDAAMGILEVRIRGELYRFCGVPIDVYRQFTHSPDLEHFFEYQIHHRYPYEHVLQTLPADI